MSEIMRTYSLIHKDTTIQGHTFKLWLSIEDVKQYLSSHYVMLVVPLGFAIKDPIGVQNRHVIVVDRAILCRSCIHWV